MPSELTSAEVAHIPNVPEQLDNTVKLGNEYAHIQTTPEALRDDLIVEAVRQGIPHDIAKAHAAKTTFSFSSKKDFLIQRAQAQSNRLESLAYRVRSVSSMSRFTGGFVMEEQDGSFYCNVAVEPLAKIVSDKYAHEHEEVQEAALAQTINGVWRHEREHLIQYMKPFEKGIIEKGHMGSRIINTAALGLTGVTLDCFLLNQDLSNPTIKSLVLLTAASNVAAVASTMYRKKFSRPERQGNKAMKQEQATQSSPFHVSFEKDSMT